MLCVCVCVCVCIVQLQCRRSQVRSPAGADIKTFANVENLLTTFVSAGLSNDSGSILLNIDATIMKNNIYLQKLYMLELDLSSFLP